MPVKAKPAIEAKQAAEKENVVEHGRTKTIIRNAATEVVVKVNQKQSLNILQTSVTASLSTILFIKNVFPPSYYEHRSYDFKSADFSYSVTPSDARSILKQNADENIVSWDMLLPGKHPHVDKMLYWLEGIGEAIKLKYLATFVISLHHDHIAPDTLAEAFVLNFSYKDGLQTQVGLTMGKETVDITLQNQRDMKNLFYRLLKLANANRVELPQHPAIGMQLTYNDTCPEDYEPRGFRAAPQSKWIEETGASVVGSMDSGYHKLEMRMLPPPNVVAMAPVPPKTPHGADRTLNLDSSSQASQYTESVVATPVRETRRMVRGMMTHQQAGFDTQLPSGLNNDIRAPPKAVEGGSSIGRDHRSIAKPAGRIFVFDRRRAAPIRIEALISETSLLPTHGDANCICGKDKEGEGHACQGCGAVQHRNCYGLVKNDTLKTFFCYACLLKPNQSLLKEMKDVCQLRRFLAIIANDGYPLTESELAKSTGYMVKEAKAVTSRLVEEGYLLKVYRKNEKKAKAFRKDPLPPPFEFDETQRDRLLKEYWNPAYKVGKFVHDVPQKEKFTMAKQPKAKLKDTAIPPTPPPSKPQPAVKPAATKSKPINQELKMDDDDDDDDDDDLSSLRRRSDISDARGSSSRTGSPVRLPPMAKKRKGEDLEDQGRGTNMLKRSHQNSPFSPLR